MYKTDSRLTEYRAVLTSNTVATLTLWCWTRCITTLACPAITASWKLSNPSCMRITWVGDNNDAAGKDVRYGCKEGTQ